MWQAGLQANKHLSGFHKLRYLISVVVSKIAELQYNFQIFHMPPACCSCSCSCATNCNSETINVIFFNKKHNFFVSCFHSARRSRLRRRCRRFHFSILLLTFPHKKLIGIDYCLLMNAPCDFCSFCLSISHGLTWQQKWKVFALLFVIINFLRFII